MKLSVQVLTLRSESIAGSLLVLFHNSMLSSELSLTNHAIKSEQLVHLTNQTGGADISTMSYICGKCIETKTYLSRPLRLILMRN